MNYKKLAEDILQNVGGTGNVAGLTHCATRLRFNLKEESRYIDKSTSERQSSIIKGSKRPYIF